jgi:predicted MFS family arabinose efflux permease
MSRRPPARLGLLTTIIAVACGLSVANIYYAQPVLAELARSFGSGEGSVTIVVTVTQIGYAIGLIFIMPLGDLFQTRRLTPLMLLLCAAGLIGAGASSALVPFLIASVVIGTAATVAQILVPFSAHLAPEEARGAVVGRVMSGLLLGILMARTISSEAAAVLGWRAIFYISAGLMVLLALVLWRALPARDPDHDAGYGSLMRSVGQLAREHSRLRVRSVCQALVFVAFSAYWSTVAYELIDQHGFSQADVGLFALVGATGACIAPIAGRIADRGSGRIAGGMALFAGIVAMSIAGLGSSSVILLGLGGVLLDVAVTGHQIIAQREIYSLVPEARARINTVFMGLTFIGGAIGSVVAGALHASSGWGGVTVFAAAACAASFLVWAGAELMRVRGAAGIPTPAAR